MKTITLTKDGLERIVYSTSGMTVAYKQKLIDDLFEAQSLISDGRYKKD